MPTPTTNTRLVIALLRNLREAVLDQDVPVGVGGLEDDPARGAVPQAGSDRLPGEAGLAEAHDQPLEPLGVVGARVADHGTRGERHGAQAVDDDAREAHRLRELL